MRLTGSGNRVMHDSSRELAKSISGDSHFFLQCISRQATYMLSQALQVEAEHEHHRQRGYGRDIYILFFFQRRKEPPTVPFPRAINPSPITAPCQTCSRSRGGATKDAHKSASPRQYCRATCQHSTNLGQNHVRDDGLVDGAGRVPGRLVGVGAGVVLVLAVGAGVGLPRHAAVSDGDVGLGCGACGGAAEVEAGAGEGEGDDAGEDLARVVRLARAFWVFVLVRSFVFPVYSKTIQK